MLEKWIEEEKKADPAVKVCLKAGSRTIEKSVNSSDVGAIFDIQLNDGDIELRACLINADGNKQGAYYTYAKKIQNEN